MKKIIGLIIIGFMIAGASIMFLSPKTPVDASVSYGSDYIATTTKSLGLTTLIQSGVGTFGSIVITGANTGTITVYDSASTTIDVASSSIMASFPASVAANTYTFDVRYTKGLVIGLSATATAPTSTITYR